ncbi:hypothetical protein ACTNBM_02875 [Lachnospiraceae bacterium HCP1S3_C3]
MKKKIVSLVAMVTATTLLNYYTGANIYASDDNYVESSYEQFLLEEAEESTGILDEDVEYELNMQGVFDREIEAFDEETINRLNDGAEYSVAVGYYEEDVNVITEMSDKDIEEYYDEIYEQNLQEDLREGNSIELENKVDNDKSIMEKLGLVNTVYAEKSTTETNKLKFTLITTQSCNKTSIYVAGSAEWLKDPDNTLNDYLSISATGLDTIFDDKQNYGACYRYEIYNYGGSVKPVKYSRADVKPIKVNNNGISTCVNLCDNTPVDTYKNHKIYIGGHFYVNNRRSEGVIGVKLGYIHQEKKHDGNISINATINSQGKLGISASNSLKVSDYYHNISTVPSMSFHFDPNYSFK